MNRIVLCAAVAVVLGTGLGAAHAESFTYHGTLQDAGKPADGAYDLRLTLYSTAQGGSAMAMPVQVYGVTVHDGSFSTNVDFGALSGLQSQAWLEVAVKPAGSASYATLDTRSPVSPDVNSCPGAWSLDGNSGNPAGSYMGTADAKDVQIKANGADVFYAPSATASSHAVALSGSSHTAAGIYSTAVSGAHAALGAFSFAGGESGATAHAGSFVWGDYPTFQHSIQDSAANQFIVQSSGGLAINGVPKDSTTEMSIYPSAANGADYSDLYMGSRSGAAGVLLTTGNATSGTANDANFYINDYNGTNEVRMLTVEQRGLTVGGQVGSSTVTLLPNGASSKVVFEALGSSSADMGLFISRNNVAGGGVQAFLNFDAAGDLQIFSATAEKPGGGSWTATSDRRIEQDIETIHDARDTVMKLRPVNFHYTPAYRSMENGLEDKTYAGFIAQEYADVFPEAVVSTSKRVPGSAKGDASILALDPNPALITTVAAVQELTVENAALHAQIDDLATRLAKLESGKGE